MPRMMCYDSGVKKPSPTSLTRELHAAQVEIDIKTARACTLRDQAMAFRSKAVTSRDRLNELRIRYRLAG